MKTTFRRQVTMVLCILLAATILIGVFFWLIFARYAQEEQEHSLDATAQSVGALVQAYAYSGLNNWDFRTNLAVAAASSESDVLLCDSEGNVNICAADIQGCEHLGQSLGAEVADALFSGGKAELNQAVSAIYGDQRLAVALPVTIDDTRYCIVLASIQQAALSDLTRKTLTIFAMTALLTLLVALIAAPYITNRETKPIRTMAAAARQIAHGNLDVRIPTGQQSDEMEELAVAFNNMTTALKNSERVRQEFVANVSHELKTPITTIAGYLDGMLDGTIPQEKQRYYMELVSTEARRLSRLVRSMLEVSRLQDQGIPADRMEDFDICDEAGQSLLCFEQQINRKHLNVEIHMPDEGLRVHGMKDAIVQVLHNLMDNAVKFIDDGGTLTVAVKKQGSSAVITVGNTGPTIPPEELPLLFDRFHKTDKSRSTDRDGVGLGLYIVKTIVLAHGEDIFVTSRDHKTEFTFTMSLAK